MIKVGVPTVSVLQPEKALNGSTMYPYPYNAPCNSSTNDSCFLKGVKVLQSYACGSPPPCQITIPSPATYGGGYVLSVDVDEGDCNGNHQDCYSGVQCDIYLPP